VKVFDDFNHDGDDRIDFKEFLLGLSLVTHGSTEDKLKCVSPSSSKERHRERQIVSPEQTLRPSMRVKPGTCARTGLPGETKRQRQDKKEREKDKKREKER